MKVLAAIIFTLVVAGGVVTAQAHTVDDCHALSDSVYGMWGCR